MHDGHDHTHGEATETDKSKLLLRFTLDHNTQHVAEAKALAEKLETESRAEAAALLRESITLYEAGNEKIQAALHKL
ncbi:MAG: hypothetical protein LBN12_07905 [Clostridiales Family XIII bacterium]|nr:hypothetical protein [Clostridiales Family XIII bacterium]